MPSSPQSSGTRDCDHGNGSSPTEVSRSSRVRGILIGCTIFGLFVTLILFASNELIRGRRAIYVLNASGAPVTVQIDNRAPLSVADFEKIPITEGRHRLHVSGPVDEAHDVVISSRFFDRWTTSPVWILNPGGEAVIESRTITYGNGARAVKRSLIVGEPFVAFPHADYAFRVAPDPIDAKAENPRVSKLAVNWVQGGDVAAFQELKQRDRAAALKFAKQRLKHATDPDLVRAYLKETATTDRARTGRIPNSGLEP